MTRRFFRGVSILALGEIVVRLKSVVVIPLLTQYFGTVRYGAWAQVAVLITVVPPLIILGTDTAVARYLPGTPRDHQARWFMGWIVGISCLAVPLCIALYLARDPVAILFFGTARRYANLIPLAAGYVFVTVVILVIRTWFRIQDQPGWYSIVSAGQAVSGVVAVVLVLVWRQGVYQAVLYDTLGQAVLALGLLTRILVTQGWVPPDLSALRPLVRFGIAVLPAGYAMWGLNWLDRIFLVKYTSLSAIGVYSLAYSIGLLAVQTGLNPIWTMFPNASAALWNQGDKEGLQRLFDWCAGTTLLLVMPAVAASAVLSGGLIHLIAPGSFAAGGPVVPLVLAGYGAAMIAAYYESLFWLIQRPMLSTAAVIVAFLVNLGLNFALIPPFGYIGAAVATGIAFSAQLAFSMSLATRMRLVQTRWRVPLRAAVATLAMTVVLVIGDETLGSSGVANVLAIAAGGTAVYALAIVALGIVSPRGAAGAVSALVRRVSPTRRAGELHSRVADSG